MGSGRCSACVCPAGAPSRPPRRAPQPFVAVRAGARLRGGGSDAAPRLRPRAPRRASWGLRRPPRPPASAGAPRRPGPQASSRVGGLQFSPYPPVCVFVAVQPLLPLVYMCVAAQFLSPRVCIYVHVYVCCSPVVTPVYMYVCTYLCLLQSSPYPPRVCVSIHVWMCVAVQSSPPVCRCMCVYIRVCVVVQSLPLRVCVCMCVHSSPPRVCVYRYMCGHMLQSSPYPSVCLCMCTCVYVCCSTVPPTPSVLQPSPPLPSPRVYMCVVQPAHPPPRPVLLAALICIPHLSFIKNRRAAGERRAGRQSRGGSGRVGLCRLLPKGLRRAGGREREQARLGLAALSALLGPARPVPPRRPAQPGTGCSCGGGGAGAAARARGRADGGRPGFVNKTVTVAVT